MAVTNVSGTTWTVTRGYEGAAPWAHAANWTAIPVLTAGGFANYLYVGTTFNNIQGFGARAGSSDNSTAITNAIAAGGVTLVPPGIFTSAPLTLPPGAVIQGLNAQTNYGNPVAGSNPAQQSVLKLKAGSTSPLLSPYDGGTNTACNVNIFDLALDGNGIALGAAGNVGTCINLPDSGSAIGRFWNIQRVYAANAGGTGSDSSATIYIGHNNVAVTIKDLMLWNFMSGAVAGTAGLCWYGSDGILENAWICGFATGLSIMGGANDSSFTMRGGGIYHCTTDASIGGLGAMFEHVSFDHAYNDGIYAAYSFTLTACQFHDNSLAANNTWSHIHAASNITVTAVGCKVSTDSGDAGSNHAKYFLNAGSGVVFNSFGNQLDSGATLSTGWTNYSGTVSAPGFPASTTAVTNTTGGDVQAFIANGAAAITAITLGSTVTGMTIPASGTTAIRIPNGQSIEFTYASGTPTWTWVIG
jgi:hypothetical protein